MICLAAAGIILNLETVETVETVQTVKTAETVKTEDMKKYDSLTHSLAT